jgi:hypothetical protein
MQAEHILFHPFKHHLSFIAAAIRSGEAHAALKTLGASQFDLYTGAYSEASIRSQVAALLSSHTRTTYQEWIAANNGHRALVLPDGSGWTLRYLEQERFVHLHPARYASHTVRIKANAMKTVVALLLAGYTVPEAAVINLVRKEIDLSPVAEDGDYAEINKVFRLLLQQLDV